jgi:hypothetical protein
MLCPPGLNPRFDQVLANPRVTLVEVRAIAGSVRRVQDRDQGVAVMRYLVFSQEHLAFWGPGRAGYTNDLMQAGRYSRQEALDICRDALPGQWKPGMPFPELPIAEGDLVAMLERR